MVSDDAVWRSWRRPARRAARVEPRGGAAPELAAAAGAEQVDVEAVLEALDRLGLCPAEPDEPTDPVLLPHPACAAEPTRSKREKPADVPAAHEAVPVRGSKDKTSPKRSA